MNDHFDASDSESPQPGFLQMMVEGIAHMDPVSWIDRRIGVWFHRRWDKTLRRYGVLALLKELARTAVGDGSWRFYVAREGEFSGWEVEQLLKQYGVVIWGRGFDSEHIYFSVKPEQANWAEYLLKRKGVAVTTAPYKPLNDLYPQRHPEGSMPTPWSEKKRRG